MILNAIKISSITIEQWNTVGTNTPLLKWEDQEQMLESAIIETKRANTQTIPIHHTYKTL